MTLSDPIWGAGATASTRILRAGRDRKTDFPDDGGDRVNGQRGVSAADGPSLKFQTIETVFLHQTMHGRELQDGALPRIVQPFVNPGFTDGETPQLGELLHNDLQQLLVAALYHADNIGKAIGDKIDNPSLQQLPEILRQALKVCRHLTTQLVPRLLHEECLLPACIWLASEMQRLHGLHITLQATPDVPKLNDEIQAFLFESVRELLFNVVKHSGCRTATIDMSTEGTQFSIRVSDEGTGFAADPFSSHSEVSSLGLSRIRKRLQSLGGEFQLETAVNQGTHIVLSVPLDA